MTSQHSIFYPWLDITSSFNPAIHRIKEAIYHLATTTNLDTDPVPPPHHELLRYFNPPSELVENEEINGTIQRLKRVLDVKVVVERKKQKREKNKEREEGDNDSVDDDKNIPEADIEVEDHEAAQISANSSSKPQETLAGDVEPPGAQSYPHDLATSSRIISNASSLSDFQSLMASGGELVARGIKEFGEVILENLEAASSGGGDGDGDDRSKVYEEAIKCLMEMRTQAMLVSFFFRLLVLHFLGRLRFERF